jgi:hypothetical protein
MSSGIYVLFVFATEEMRAADSSNTSVINPRWTDGSSYRNRNRNKMTREIEKERERES